MPFHGEARRVIPFHTVPERDQWVVSDEPAYLVVTEKNWSTYYLNPPRGSNFATSIYIVVSIGAKPNPGYSVRIRQLERVKDRITVKVELKEPDPRKVYPQIIVHPVAVAEVAKADLKPRGMLDLVFIDQKDRQLATVETEI